MEIENINFCVAEFEELFDDVVAKETTTPDYEDRLYRGKLWIGRHRDITLL